MTGSLEAEPDVRHQSRSLLGRQSMRLNLHYRGHLRANGTPTHKHELRQHFHRQLAKLWQQIPLSLEQEWLQPRTEDSSSVLRPIGGFTFAPLVTEQMHVIAELSVTLLRPEPPGGLITQGGDIDNRLKTLFDALTMPRHPNQIPNGLTPTADEVPFFCLLEDDNLITSMSVQTHQLLEQVEDTSTVDLTVFVRTRVTATTFGNFPFA